MKRFLMLKKDMDIDYREHILYLLILIVIGSSSVFLSSYVFFAPFKPAIIVHIIYIVYHVILLYFLKKKFYMFVKLSILLTFIIQLTLAVYLWFPITSGYNLFYYMVPIATFLTMNIEKKYERYFAIFLSVLAALLFLGSVVLTMDYYMYELNREVARFTHAFTVISTILPSTVIFYHYTLGLAQKQKELRRLANTDALTQITNRRVLFEEGEQEVLLARKYEHEFTLIQFDIDYFKRVNDSYGHPVGDQVLIQLSQLIREHIRKEDTFSRHGGEEFAVIVRKTSKESGLSVSEKLRTAVEDHLFTVDDHTLHITISIGTTQYDRKYRTFDQMMSATDQALYEAKDKGRNCVIASD